VSSGFFPPFQQRPQTSGLYAPADQARRLPGVFGGVGVGFLGSLAGVLADLGRIPVPYTLEIRQGEVLVAAVALPLTPSQVSYQRPGATDLSYTFGAVPYREPSEHRRLDVTLSGSSGLAPRAGNNRFAQIVWASGPDLVRELDAFLDIYQRGAAEAAARHLAQPDGPSELHSAQGSHGDSHNGSHEPLVLVYRSLRDKVHLRCEVKSWRRSSDASRSRHSEDWALELQGWAPAEPVEPRNFLGPIADAALYVAALIGGVNNTLAAADTILGNVRGDLEVLRAPALAVAQTARLFGQVGARGGELAAFPRTLAADWLAVAGAFGVAWGEWEDSGSALAGLFDPATWGVERAAQDVARAQLLARPALGALGGGPETVEQARTRRSRGVGQDLGPASGAAGFVPRGGQERGPAPLRYVWSPGDTLGGIARRFGVALADLVRLNGIRAGALPSGAALGPGALLLIPGTAQGVAGGGEAGFGVDLLVNLDTGDLVQRSTDQGSVLALVDGPTLVEQALGVRFLTSQGESRAFPGYGLPRLVGDPSSALTAGLLAIHAQEQVLRDPRIGEVRRLEVEDGGDVLRVGLEVLAKSGEPLAFSAPLNLGVEV